VAKGNSSYSGGTVPDFHRSSLTVRPFRCRIYHAKSMASRWLPVLVWAGVIFAFSAVPSLSSGLGGWDLLLRKLAHMTEYAILALLLVRATGSYARAFALTVAYATTDEVHQLFVRGRHGSPIDVAIDAVGALIGLGLLRSKLYRWSTER
jgi:VanZ family protein